MKTNSNKIKDQKFLHDYFKQHNMEVVYESEGVDEDDDGYQFEYLSVIIQTDHKVLHPMYEFDDESILNDLQYYAGYDYHLDRGIYFGDIEDNQYEIRFARLLD